MEQIVELDKIHKARNYRDKHKKEMTFLLDNLINTHSCSALQQEAELTILVVGAGSFPSYTAFIKRLRNILPLIETIHITLVEPDKNATALFENHFANDDIHKTGLTVNFHINNNGLKEFLQTNKQTFDIIYFEHPEMMTLTILLAKLGIGNRNILSLREFIPLLSTVFKSNTILLASCMSKHELFQIKSLLTFSFGGNKSTTLTSRNPIDYFYGGPYSSGLIYRMQHTSAELVAQHKKIKIIQNSHTYLCLFMLASFIIYCLRASYPHYFIEQTLSVLFMCAQLLFHKPGKSGLAIKVFLLSSQLIL